MYWLNVTIRMAQGIQMWHLGYNFPNHYARFVLVALHFMTLVKLKNLEILTQRSTCLRYTPHPLDDFNLRGGCSSFLSNKKNAIPCTRVDRLGEISTIG
jgi:hypothetical protein